MSVNLTDPVEEQALARLVTELSAITDNSAVALFNTVGRGQPLRQSFVTETLPAAYVIAVDFRAENREFEESVVERDLFGVLIVAEGVGETDDDRMSDLSTTLMRLCGRVRTGTPTGLEGSILNGLCPNGIHWVRTYTPAATANMPINAVMPVFRGHLAFARTNPLVT